MMRSDPLSTVLSALADPTRRAILAQLANGEATVSDLAAPYKMSLAAVSKHLKVLEGAGLISRSRDAQFRPCRLDAVPLGAVNSWLNTYRRFWEENLDQLETYLADLQKGDPSGQVN